MLHRLNHLIEVKYIAHIQTWKVVLIDGGVGLESFAFDPHGKGPYTGVSDGLESSNDNVLRVVWIYFDADQFHAIVYVATELFLVCPHVNFTE